MFKVQQEFYNVLKDASVLGLTKQDIRKLMKRRDFSNREINTLFRGKFTPFKVSESLMQKRLRDLKKAYPNEIINKDFFYPRKDFNRVMRKYRKKSLKVEQPEEDETSIFNKIYFPKSRNSIYRNYYWLYFNISIYIFFRFNYI